MEDQKDSGRKSGKAGEFYSSASGSSHHQLAYHHTLMLLTCAMIFLLGQLNVRIHTSSAEVMVSCILSRLPPRALMHEFFPL